MCFIWSQYLPTSGLVTGAKHHHLWRAIMKVRDTNLLERNGAGIAKQISLCGKRQTQTAKYLEGFVGNAPLEWPRLVNVDDLKTHSFYPEFDRLLIEMKQRQTMKGESTLNPKHTSFLDKQRILPWPVIREWVRKTCVMSSTRLAAYCKEKNKRGIPFPTLRSSYPLWGCAKMHL